MVCSQARRILLMRGLILVMAGLGGVVIWPSLSLAQYPGSAGDLNVGAFEGLSSASSGLSSGSTSSSASATELVLAPVLPATWFWVGPSVARSLQIAGIVMAPAAPAATPRGNAR